MEDEFSPPFAVLVFDGISQKYGVVRQIRLTSKTPKGPLSKFLFYALSPVFSVECFEIQPPFCPPLAKPQSRSVSRKCA